MPKKRPIPLASAREAASLSVPDVSRASGIPASSWRRYEDGKRPRDPRRYAIMAHAVGRKSGDISWGRNRQIDLEEWLADNPPVQGAAS